MINLNSILQSAQGGTAIDHLSARFGLSPDQTQSAIDALLPALQMGLQNKVESGGIGSLFGHGDNSIHRGTYSDPASAHGGASTTAGSTVLGDLFGGALTQVVQQAAQRSGVPAAIVQAMLPVIVSMLLGGLMHGAQNGAFGGILSNVLGSVLGQHGSTAAPTPPATQDSAPGGILGGILGGLFGNSRDGATARPDDAPATAPPTPAVPGSYAATLDEISGMFEAGSPPAPEHQAQLASLLGR